MEIIVYVKQMFKYPRHLFDVGRRLIFLRRLHVAPNTGSWSFDDDWTGFVKRITIDAAK